MGAAAIGAVVEVYEETYRLPKPNAANGSSLMPSSLFRCSSEYLSGLKRKGSGYRELSCKTALGKVTVCVFEWTVYRNKNGGAPDVGENRCPFRDGVSSILVIFSDCARKTERSH